jgi:hypothetical protein
MSMAWSGGAEAPLLLRRHCELSTKVMAGTSGCDDDDTDDDHGATISDSKVSTKSSQKAGHSSSHLSMRADNVDNRVVEPSRRKHHRHHHHDSKRRHHEQHHHNSRKSK